MGAAALLTNDDLSMRETRATEHIDAAREKRRVIAHNNEDAMKRSSYSFGRGSWRSETWVRERMTEINYDSIRVLGS